MFGNIPLLRYILFNHFIGEKKQIFDVSNNMNALLISQDLQW